MSTGHARLSPSKWAQWSRCPGSLRLTAGLLETSSVYADEGTAAHFLASESLAAGGYSFGHIGRQIGIHKETGKAEWVETSWPMCRNLFTVDAEMAEHVDKYIDYLIGKHE